MNIAKIFSPHLDSWASRIALSPIRSTRRALPSTYHDVILSVMSLLPVRKSNIIILASIFFGRIITTVWLDGIMRERVNPVEKLLFLSEKSPWSITKVYSYQNVYPWLQACQMGRYEVSFPVLHFLSQLCWILDILAQLCWILDILHNCAESWTHCTKRNVKLNIIFSGNVAKVPNFFKEKKVRMKDFCSKI